MSREGRILEIPPPCPRLDGVLYAAQRNDLGDGDRLPEAEAGCGRHLFVADNYGIEVLNVDDPANPGELAEYDGLRGAHDIFVVGSFIYVAEAKKGLIVFELKQEQ